ncbi:hypothetical protein CPLU01_10195 [Colletotrichum plurivorum]|uniref:Uncharacterized protein n=1 Tax=Colletotrichum plurivorum TaxID=2175906 RepID=A0A8H6N9R8_9PEZI|nr:hypothetical protein CPLU01_10195 [Colletotrichum plurivorum]
MSSNGHAVLNGISRKVAARTVQVTVVPRPMKFAERRAVLHALQKFARIDVFKKLDDHPSSFISVLSERSQMKELIKLSPLQYQLATPRPTGSVRGFLTDTTSTDPVISSEPASEAPRRAADPDLAADHADHKEFTLHIFPAETYIHSAANRSSKLHGSWPEARRGTTMSHVLKAAMPDDVAAEGLSDWETGGQVAASARGQMLEDVLLGTKSVDVGKRAITDRISRRAQREKSLPIMEGLLHLQQSHKGH